MRVNSDSLHHWAQSKPSEKEGYLVYKSSKEDFKQRWFRLIGNMLLYYKSDNRESEPLGMLLLENFKSQMEPPSTLPFVFSIEFEGDPRKKQLFSGRTEQICIDWMRAVNAASLQAQREKLESLYSQVCSKARQRNYSLEHLHTRLPPYLSKGSKPTSDSARLQQPIPSPQPSTSMSRPHPISRLPMTRPQPMTGRARTLDRSLLTGVQPQQPLARLPAPTTQSTFYTADWVKFE